MDNRQNERKMKKRREAHIRKEDRLVNVLSGLSEASDSEMNLNKTSLTCFFGSQETMLLKMCAGF